jgi:hypothetical protein
LVAPVSYGVGNSPNAAVVADLNGDGIQDIVEANYTNNTISVLLGKADGTFQPQVTYATGAGPYGVAIGDFNGDGIPDVVTPNGDGTISVLLENGDGTFQAQASYATPGGPVAVSVADFNGDGIQDLAIACNASGTISVLLGNGDGTFQNPVTYVIGRNPSAIASGDCRDKSSGNWNCQFLLQRHELGRERAYFGRGRVCNRIQQYARGLLHCRGKLQWRQ